MKPYPYQQTVISDTRAFIKSGNTDILIVVPTGGGKTAISAFMTAAMLKAGKRVWFVAPLDALIRQTYDEYCEILGGVGIPSKLIGIIHPAFKPSYERPVQVVAQITVDKRIKSGKVKPCDFPDLLFEDEAHTTSFRKASERMLSKIRLEKSKQAVALLQAKSIKSLPFLRMGLTASPTRSNKKESFALQGYKAAVIAPSTNELTGMGRLSPLKFYEEGNEDLMDQVTLSNYDDDKIRTLYDTPEAISQAVDLYEQKGEQGKAICFCVDVKHGENVSAEFNKRGYVSEVISYLTPVGKKGDQYPGVKTRESMFEAFRKGVIHVLSSVDALAVGFNVKDVIVAMLLRPTKSLNTHIQQLGRIRRTAAGKSYGIVLDVVGNCLKHGYGDDEWDADKVLALPEKSEPGENPFQVACVECREMIHAAVKTCPHCGTLQPVKESQVKEVSFSSGLIETLRPNQLNADSVSDAQRYYRYLRQRAVIRHRSLPGRAYMEIRESKIFGKWANVIPHGRSMWTLGSIFNAPESVASAETFYKFLNYRLSQSGIEPALQARKVWYAMDQEFTAQTLDTLRAQIGSAQFNVKANTAQFAKPGRTAKKARQLVPVPSF